MEENENYTSEPIVGTNSQPVVPAEPESSVSAVPSESKFTGGAFANFFIGLLTGLVSALTLGLAYPAMVCWKLRWKANHTYINGRKLVFDGKGGQLFGRFLLWMFLSIVTLGIYAMLAMPLNMKRWQTKHTHFEGSQGESRFDGSIWGLFGVNFVCNLVSVVTFSFGSYWAHCYRERWYCKHEVIDGCRMAFDGKGIQYFGKCIVWRLLTVITLGIYAFWLVVKQEKWTISHKHAEDVNTIPAFVPELVRETPPVKDQTAKSVVGMILAIVGAIYPLPSGTWLMSGPEMVSYIFQTMCLAIPALVLSIISLKSTKEKGMAITGIVISGITMASVLVYFPMVILFRIIGD